ncbi:hypothetical protein [Nonomuraea phyllanthi]|uniref:hypothetical protein n=1 Tax=Nonomuraea phyllanthi TaxID=2219224 RepID=UPI00186AC022|nr:hypothetical protein [Nonomuraea phyllanthi]
MVSLRAEERGSGRRLASDYPVLPRITARTARLPEGARSHPLWRAVAGLGQLATEEPEKGLTFLHDVIGGVRGGGGRKRARPLLRQIADARCPGANGMRYATPSFLDLMVRRSEEYALYAPAARTVMRVHRASDVVEATVRAPSRHRPGRRPAHPNMGVDHHAAGAEVVGRRV